MSSSFCFCNLSSTSDPLSPTILLTKLLLSDRHITWFNIYFSNRQKSVCILDNVSLILKFFCSPTGSCFGIFAFSVLIISLVLFRMRNKNQLLVNSDIYYIDTRQYANFQQSSMNLTKYQKGVYYLSVHLFNVLPACIQIESDNPKNYELVLQKFLYENFLLLSG
jgi:hypothetical protein